MSNPTPHVRLIYNMAESVEIAVPDDSLGAKFCSV